MRYVKTTSTMQVIDFGEPIMVKFYSKDNPDNKANWIGIVLDSKVMKKMATREKNKTFKELK